MRYTIAMDLRDGAPAHIMSEEEVSVMFGGRDWQKWEDQMVRLLVENKAAFTVKDAKGNEIFYCTYSPDCQDQICYAYSDARRFDRFVDYINKRNVKRA